MPEQTEKTTSLYERIGGEPTIASLVEAFYNRVLADPELQPFFQHTQMDRLLRMQHEFFSAALGGPVAYAGLPLAHAHFGRGIKLAHFGRFIDHLVATLEAYQLDRDDVTAIIDRVNLYADEVTGSASMGG
jgi:hemoglobin